MCRYVLLTVLIVLLAACGTVRQAGTHDFKDGYFIQKKAGETPAKVYLQVTDTVVNVYGLYKGSRTPVAIPLQRISLKPSPEEVKMEAHFIKHSIDLDISTILFKYRLATHDVPPQLNSNLNVAVYAGYRTDFYTLKEHLDPLQQRSRLLRHFEMDVGFFVGIGSVAVNSSTTNNTVSLEYDGVSLQKGVAVFFGTASFTLGVGVGTDNLLGKNKKNWIYRDKPWLGVMIGLNITN